MPNIIKMFNFWISFSQPLIDLFVPVSHNYANSHLLLFQILYHTTEALFLHVIATSNFIALNYIIIAVE